jgi:hypothetical protein
MQKSILAVVLAAALHSPTSAATIWNEATDGDLGVKFVDAQTLSFGLGINRIIGEAHHLVTPEGWSDWDNDEFLFTIPNGSKLRAITLRFNVLEDANSSFLQTGYLLTQWVSPYLDVLNLYNWLINEQEPALVSNQVEVKGLDLAAPQYFWADRGILSSYGTRWAYQYDFLVSAVPLPSTVALLAVGAAGIGVGRRAARSAE